MAKGLLRRREDEGGGEGDDEEEDEEEDEEPAPRRRAKKATPKKKKVTRSRAAKDGMVGSSEVAEHFGIEPRSLRVLLRKNKIPKDADSGTYQWRSLTSPAVVKIGKLIKSGGVRKAQQENFDKLRKRAPKKSPAKKTTATKTRRRRASEDED